VLRSKIKSYNCVLFRVVLFEGLVDVDNQFAHHRGESDFGWFALGAEVVVKLSQGGLFLFGQRNGTHVEGAPHSSTTAADMTLALPRSALPSPGRQACQGPGLLTVELSQLRHVTQQSDGRDEAHAGHLVQNLNLLVMAGTIGQRFGQLFFHRVDAGLELLGDFGLLFEDEGIGGVFAMLAGTHQLLLELGAPINQGAHFGQCWAGFWRWRGLMGSPISGEHSAVQRIALGTAALGQSEMTHMARIKNRNRKVRLLKGCDDLAFIPAGGLANDLDIRAGIQQGQEFFVTRGRVGQGVLAVLEVELEGGLGNVQAGIDGGSWFRHNRASCSAHSCTYEHVGIAAAQSTVRVTDNRHERLRLPHEHVQTVPEGNEHARAAALRPAGRRAAPSSGLACRQTRRMKKDIQEGRGEGELFLFTGNLKLEIGSFMLGPE